MIELITSGLAQMGLLDSTPPDAGRVLDAYGRLLLEKNHVMNLTAITHPHDVATLHMLDCAALLQYCDFKDKRLLDIGTGAGFPGMVLKILAPSLEVTLLDSLNKRLEWLGEVAKTLSLQGIGTIHTRAEEAGQTLPLRESFDFATARAVADLRLLCELCLPFVKVGGQFLAMKGTGCDHELETAQPAIKALGGELVGVHDYPIPHTHVHHRVVIIQKISHTSPLYPRRWASMQKSPL